MEPQVGNNLSQENETHKLGLADNAQTILDKILLKQRYSYLFGTPPKEDVTGNIEALKKEKDSFCRVLEGWEIASQKSKDISWTKPDSEESREWYQKKIDYYNALDNFLWYGISEEKLTEHKGLNGDDIKDLKAGGYGILTEMIDELPSNLQGSFIKFLNEEMKLPWEDDVSTTSYHSEKRGKFKIEFNNVKEQLLPIYEKLVKLSVENGNKDNLRNIFYGFKNVDSDKEAQNTLEVDGLSDEQRLQVVVEYANVFGYMHTIDFLSRKIKSEGLGTSLRKQYGYVYGELEGEKAQGIAADLSVDIYQKIDFSQYALNHPEVTAREADVLERVIMSLENVVEANKHNIEIFDVGAGVGRHSLELAKRGYQKITALDFEQKHIDYIREHNPEIKTIQGNWHELDKLYGKKADLVFIFGRSITHNRTPQEMLHCFDQLVGVTKENGRLCFDFEDYSYGLRGEKISSLRKNITAKGIVPLRSEIIFDGPDDSHRFNRQILRPDQVKAVSDLFGLKIVSNEHQSFGDSTEVKDVYYTLEKDSEVDIKSMTQSEFNENLRVLGLLDAGTDYDVYIDAWGMTLGQAVVYVRDMGLGNEHIRKLNKEGRGPKVILRNDEKLIEMTAIGMNARDDKFARTVKSRNIDQYEEMVKTIQKRKAKLARKNRKHGKIMRPASNISI